MFEFFNQETVFKQFGLTHILTMIFFVISCLVVVAWARFTHDKSKYLSYDKRMGIFIFTMLMFFQAYKIYKIEIYRGWVLPIQICDVAAFAASAALYFDSRLAKSLLYFWGLTLSSQGIFTPDTWFDFPHLDFFRYWFLHLSVVITAVYFVFGKKFRPTWRDYRNACLMTFVWCTCVYQINWLFKSNYVYLNGKPEAGSVLDILPPWPYYIAIVSGILMVVWALMTWPFNRGTKPEPV